MISPALHIPLEDHDRPSSTKKPGDGRGWPIKTLALIAIIAVLYIGKPVFLPIAVALILSFLLRPVVRLLKEFHIPKTLGALAVLGVIIGMTAFAAIRLSTPASEWLERLPRSMHEVKGKLEGLRKPVEKVSLVAKQVDEITAMPADEPKLKVEVKNSSLADALFTSAQEFFGMTIVTAILLFFLLASGDSFLTRIVQSLPPNGWSGGNAILGGKSLEKDSERLLQETEHQIGAYLWTVTLINAGLGTAIGGALALLGMPNPVMWGVLSFILNYVPYLGNTIGIILVAVASLISFDTLAEAIAPPIAFALLVAVEANIVTPIVLGRRFTMSPIVIFVWTVFWTWMWGFSGAFVAVPMLAFIKALCDRVEPFMPLARAMEP